MQLSKELNTAIALARTAGKAIMEFYDSDFLVEEKTTKDNHTEPVTIADKTASKIIVEGLLKEFPDDGILSEEETDTHHRLDKKRLWLIDPMDGTKGFVQKNGDFAVQIGLAEDGEMKLGVVFLPFENVLYFASKGNGAFVVENDESPKLLQVSAKTDFTEMILAVSRDHRSPKMSRVDNHFGFSQEIQRGSVGLKIGLIANQICDIYIHLSPRTKHWDSAAPEIIIKEAGGNLTDLFGDTILYNTSDVHNHNGILATNGVSHEKAVKSLRPLLTQFGRLRIQTIR
ncbi:MAG: 3'(2'),5'-bisphosphate nucleotidase CysQ [Acidobacteriota bacterium]